jgi:hypothetical protein
MKCFLKRILKWLFGVHSIMKTGPCNDGPGLVETAVLP